MNNLEKGSISNLLMHNTAPSCYDVFVANDEVEIGEVEIGEGKTVSRKAVFHVQTPRSLGDENELSIDCTEETMIGNENVYYKTYLYEGGKYIDRSEKLHGGVYECVSYAMRKIFERCKEHSDKFTPEFDFEIQYASDDDNDCVRWISAVTSYDESTILGYVNVGYRTVAHRICNAYQTINSHFDKSTQDCVTPYIGLYESIIFYRRLYDGKWGDYTDSDRPKVNLNVYLKKSTITDDMILTCYGCLGISGKIKDFHHNLGEDHNNAVSEACNIITYHILNEYFFSSPPRMIIRSIEKYKHMVTFEGVDIGYFLFARREDAITFLTFFETAVRNQLEKQ